MYNDLLFKFWNDRKEKQKHNELNFAYFVEILEKMIQCFDYENVPEGIDISFLEQYLLINGTVGISKSQVNSGTYTCYIGGYCGNLNEYGIGTSYTGATVGGTYQGVIDRDCVVGLNNSIRTGRTNILDRYSGLLANIEESINIGIINSRILPIVECASDKDVDQIKSVSNQIKHGDLVAVSSKTVSVFDDNNNSIKSLPIFDSKDIEKLQYYSRFYEDTLKRLWIESGVEITNKDKSAQVNSDELQSFNRYSRITIEDMLKCREKMCADFNKLFGGEWSVKLNHIFDNKITSEDGEREVEEDGSLPTDN